MIPKKSASGHSLPKRCTYQADLLTFSLIRPDSGFEAAEIIRKAGQFIAIQVEHFERVSQLKQCLGEFRQAFIEPNVFLSGELAGIEVV